VSSTVLAVPFSCQPLNHHAPVHNHEKETGNDEGDSADQLSVEHHEPSPLNIRWLKSPFHQPSTPQPDGQLKKSFGTKNVSPLLKGANLLAIPACYLNEKT
jgi:hypothetical protein